VKNYLKPLPKNEEGIYDVMSTENIQDIYPLSPMQQGMLFHSVYTPEKGVYVEHISCALHGKLNVSAFEYAWQQAVDRNPILRTAFVWEGVDEPVQVVHKQVGLPIERLDWRKLAPEQQAIKRNEFFKSHLEQGFDLSEAPLMRLALIQEADDRFRFSWTHHHLLVDGWSMPLLLNEVFSIYESLNNGRVFHREPSRPYRDYIAWLQQQDLAKAEQFWRSYLKDAVPSLSGLYCLAAAAGPGKGRAILAELFKGFYCTDPNHCRSLPIKRTG